MAQSRVQENQRLFPTIAGTPQGGIASPVLANLTLGFDFLGQNVRKYGKKLLIKPARQGIRSVLDKARERIQSSRGQKAVVLIRKLNPVLRG